MTTVESGRAQTVESVLNRVRRAVDVHELERTWAEGLRCHRDRSDRDHILAEAGTRLRELGDASDDWIRHNWLRHVAEEFPVRDGQPLSEPLAAVVTAEMREAFAGAAEDLAGLRAATDDGQDMRGYAETSPVPAMRIRDLGRIAEQLRGSGAMALVASEDVALSIELAQALVPRRLMAIVPERMRVSRDALLGWREAERELPRLIRSLIAETEPSAEWIHLPAGTGVAQSGWDGVVRCVEGNRFVPAGLSVWELSAKKHGSDGKARSDYGERLARTTTAERADMAYVSVACAPWIKAGAFAQEMSRSGDFRSVSALNVDDLETWLECAPATTVWLREQMGDPATGVRTVAEWWRDWLGSTRVPLDGGVVLAGREAHAARLREACSSGAGAFTVGGRFHAEEILAFVAAALIDQAGSRGAETLYVEDAETARRLLRPTTPAARSRRELRDSAMTIVVSSPGIAKCLPLGSQHRMIVPVPGSTQADIVLDAVDGSTVAEHLRTAGVDSCVAQEHGSLARMSLPALRRFLAINPELHKPAWTAGPIAQTLRRSALLNSWNQSRDGDRRIVERFVGCSHEAVSDALQDLGGLDAPMIVTDDIWHVPSPADTWMLLDGQLTREDIEAFGDVSNEVLTESDPLGDLTGDERLRAQMNGVRPEHSSQIKLGIATTLALLGARPPTLRGAAVPASSAAAGVVWRILRSANNDPTPRTWTAVCEVLPLLAEAAPDAILDSLRTCLSESHPFARAVFADGSRDRFGFPPWSAHLRISDALELLAWSPDHLMAAVDLLARLDVIDPGGGWSNRPATSLSSIMCPWKPNTSASADERLNAIRMLRRSHGGVAWQLMLSMLPFKHNIQPDSRGPLYRDWKEAGSSVTHIEHYRMVTAVAGMLVEDVGSDTDRWTDLLDNVASLPDDARNEMIVSLHRVVDGRPGEAFKSAVWPKLSSTVARHREYSDAEWALLEPELEVFDSLLERLRPSAPSLVYGWLFSSGVTYVNGVRASDGWDVFQESLAASQAQAVEAILDAGGIAAVLELAAGVEQPRNIGIALARSDAGLDVEMLHVMHDASEAVTQAALGYFGLRFDELGWPGIDRLRERHALTPQATADLLRAVAPIHHPWTQVAQLGDEVADVYWERVAYYDIGVPQDLDQLLEVSRRLRGAGRCELATMLLSFGVDTHESQAEYLEEVADCMEQYVQQPSEGPARTTMGDHYLASLIKVLDRHRDHLGIARVARIEWMYYPALRHDPDFQAPNIFRGMTQEPELFAWMVELAFKPASAANEDRTEPDEKRRRLALDAFHVLRSWPEAHFVPALDENDAVDEESLSIWVHEARTHLAAIDRASIGDEMIGAALAASPPDPDRAWPGLAVRNLIERLSSDSIDRGIFLAIVNRRGVTSRSLTAGGGQERDLAGRYRTQGRHLEQWPRTAAIFAGLARSYEREADREDEEAEAHRRGLPV